MKFVVFILTFLFFTITSFIAPVDGKLNEKGIPQVSVVDSVLLLKPRMQQILQANPTTVVTLSNYSELDSLLNTNGFLLEEVRQNKLVDRVFVKDIKESLSDESVDSRKDDFIRIVLANACRVNEDIQKNRDFILSIQYKDSLNTYESQSLHTLLQQYKAENKAELMEKIDIIPPSLIICQAILESGWGTSHFACEGNSLFGEHAPANAPDAMKAREANIGLRAFPSIYKAIYGYTNNLNTHRAYRSLRAKRKELRDHHQNVDGISLAATQIHYSEIGHAYVDRLTRVIGLYELSDFDECRLKQGNNLVVNILD